MRPHGGAHDPPTPTTGGSPDDEPAAIHYFSHRELGRCTTVVTDISRGNGAKILIVDDARAVVDELSVELGRCGYDVVSAANGIEAQQRLREHPDTKLAIVDLNMPRMGGQELLEQVRRLEGLQHLPIVILTTDKASANLEKAMTGGATGWVLKPYDPERLLETIGKIVSGQHRKTTAPHE